jgi:hypothetical protein
MALSVGCAKQPLNDFGRANDSNAKADSPVGEPVITFSEDPSVPPTLVGDLIPHKKFKLQYSDARLAHCTDLEGLISTDGGPETPLQLFRNESSSTGIFGEPTVPEGMQISLRFIGFQGSAACALSDDGKTFPFTISASAEATIRFPPVRSQMPMIRGTLVPGKHALVLYDLRREKCRDAFGNPALVGFLQIDRKPHGGTAFSFTHDGLDLSTILVGEIMISDGHEVELWFHNQTEAGEETGSGCEDWDNNGGTGSDYRFDTSAGG